MHSITGAFSSLSINEPGSSRSAAKKTNSASLPNLTHSETVAPLKVLQNYSKYICEDETDATDQPVDFSKKYAENKIAVGRKPFEENNEFKNYAETDLDQPTDYSLRYADNDDPVQVRNKHENTEFVQDAIKNYYTEDTPHETPFNFSTSTSMSDLRIDDKVQRKRTSSMNETKLNPEKLGPKSECSSGLMSPEKPINYCEEGTPGYFSRVSSCGSLNSLVVNGAPKESPTKVDEEVQKTEFKVPRRSIKFPSEVKAVKFVEVVDYAEETPLMFSRTSSLASLDSIDQHSIHDDRSSVVSDLSRLTSGLVSPSELPDSPTQTVPPSPKPPCKKMVFATSQQLEAPQTSGIFQDVVKNFQMENTPSLCSRATSLSSLTIDEIDSNEKPAQHTATNTMKNDLELSESSEDEDDILAACINIGMQNTFNKPEIVISTPRNSPQVANNTNNDDSTEQKLEIANDSVRTYCTEDTPAILSHAGSNSDLSIIAGSQIINEEDEEEQENVDTIDNDVETPAELENIENISNKSTRRSSFSSSISDPISEDSSEEESLLQECIQAGMPKSLSRAIHNDTELNENDEAILQECILDGMLKNQKRHDLDQSESEEEDEDILANCINAGIANNRYTQTESDKQLPMKNVHIFNSRIQDDVENSFSDEDDEQLLSDCVKIGMARMSQVAAPRKTRNLDLNISIERNESDAELSSSLSSLSTDSCESEQLLRECILSAMPKRRNPIDETELTEIDEVVLQQCILEGMRKYWPSKQAEEESHELSEEDQMLLRKCILSGMPKARKPALSTPRNFTELTESDRARLQQCILAGMSKGSTKSLINKNFIKVKDKEPEHTCCIHCPRNRKKLKEASKLKKKHKTLVHLRESTNVNVLYVTSEVLTFNKQLLKPSHEEWV